MNDVLDLAIAPSAAEERLGLSLVLATGRRPSAPDIERVLQQDNATGRQARVVHAPQDTGWLELLVGGLVFEVDGLRPAAGTALPQRAYAYGMKAGSSASDGEAITLRPGRHVASGAAMMPLLRTMLGLGAALAQSLDAEAVCWRPASSWMAPDHFNRVVVNWLSGGVFPALGLMGLDIHSDGSVQSSGLSFFSGQEVRVEPFRDEPRDATVKLALRMIDYIVREGRFSDLQALKGPSRETLIAEPSHDGALVRVWRDS